MPRIDVRNLVGSQCAVKYESDPAECPLCGTSVVPKMIGSATINDEFGDFFAAYQCTNRQCQGVFVGRWIYSMDAMMHRPLGVYPRVPRARTFSQTIGDLSPQFISVYNEALAAEANGLSQLVGMGHRKALEFLVKDYAIARNPDDAEMIKAKALGRCIKDYIPDPRVKAVAERAIWLGNDETHYIRTWGDKDVNHLKRLVDLTVHWIELELESERLVAEMPAGGGGSQNP